jgi:UDP-N-acetylmuramoylalanine-D-glutamate ligase
LDMSALAREIPKYCKAVVFLEGTGTEKFKDLIGEKSFSKIVVSQPDTFSGCVREAIRLAKKGDTILFSPAFSSFGKWFKNEFDRGDKFNKEVNKLK